MEGTTYLEHSALGVSLNSGLMAGMLRLESFEQSVLRTLLVARWVEVLTETDTPERSTLASQVDYGHSNLELSARPMLDPNQAGNAEFDTDPSEHSALMTNVDFGFMQLDARSCPLGNVALGRRPMEEITYPLPVESLGLTLAPDFDPLEIARAAYVEDYNFDVPEGMELMTYTQRRPDGGDTRGVNAVDMVPMCRVQRGVNRRIPVTRREQTQQN